MAARLATLGAAMALVAGCGSESPADPQEQAAQAAVDKLQQAFEEGDFETACAAMSAAARRHLDRGGHFTAPSCYQDMRAFAVSLRRRERGEERQRPDVLGVEVAGDRATATLNVPGAESKLPLVRVGGAWKVDAMYGDLPAGRQPATRFPLGAIDEGPQP